MPLAGDPQSGETRRFVLILRSEKGAIGLGRSRSSKEAYRRLFSQCGLGRQAQCLGENLPNAGHAHHRHSEMTDPRKAEVHLACATRVLLLGRFLAAGFLAAPVPPGFRNFPRSSSHAPCLPNLGLPERSLPYPTTWAIAAKGHPNGSIRVGLGVTVSLLVAGAIALVAWASLAKHTRGDCRNSATQVASFLAVWMPRPRPLRGRGYAAQLSRSS